MKRIKYIEPLLVEEQICIIFEDGDSIIKPKSELNQKVYEDFKKGKPINIQEILNINA